MANIPVKMRGFKASKRALVDDEDFEKVMAFKWYEKDSGGYAVTEKGNPKKGERKRFRMHHLVNGRPPEGMVTDHINGNPLDNRKENLRFCTQAENIRNMKRAIDNRSGYKGVSYDSRRSKQKNPWRARIKFNYKQIELGCYPTAKEAHAAYQEGAKLYFGDFVRSEKKNV